MRLFCYECKKIITNKIILLFFILSILCNIAFLGFTIYQKEAIAEPLTNETQTIAQLEDQEQQELINNYPLMIDTIMKEADKASKSTLFSKPDSYTNHSLLNKIRLYSVLQDETLSNQDRTGISYLFNHMITKFLCIALLFMICLFTFAQEFEEGHMFYLKPLKNTKYKIILAKYAAVLTTSVSATIALYLSSIAFLTMIYGDLWGDGRIQELIGMIKSPWDLSILQYAGITAGIVLFLSTVLMLLFSSICNIFKSTLYSIFCMTALLLVEVACFYFITPDSYLSILHFMNIFSFIDSNNLFNDYYVMNIAGQPVPIFIITNLFFLIIGFFCLILSIKSFYSNKHVPKLVFKRLKRSKNVHKLAYYESIKFLFVKKAFFIFIIFLLFQIYVYKDYHYYESQNVFYYRVFSKQLAGELSDEKEKFIKEQNDLFSSYEKEIAQLSDDYHNYKIDPMDYEQQIGLLNKKLIPREGFHMAENQYQCLKKENKTVYIDETPYQLILGETSHPGYILLFIKVLLVLILSLGGMMAIEYETHMTIYIKTLRNQFKDINKMKYMIAFLYASAVYFISVSTELIIKFLSSRGTSLGAAVNNLLFLQINSNLPIWFYILILVLFGWFIVSLAVIFILLISRKTKKTSNAIVCSMLILLPLLILLL